MICGKMDDAGIPLEARRALAGDASLRYLSPTRHDIEHERLLSPPERALRLPRSWRSFFSSLSASHRRTSAPLDHREHLKLVSSRLESGASTAIVIDAVLKPSKGTLNTFDEDTGFSILFLLCAHNRSDVLEQLFENNRITLTEHSPKGVPLFEYCAAIDTAPSCLAYMVHQHNKKRDHLADRTRLLTVLNYHRKAHPKSFATFVDALNKNEASPQPGNPA